MFDFIKNIIEKKEFELRDMLYKINKMYIAEHLTEEQKEELEGLARNRANPQNSYAPMEKQLEAIWNAIKDSEKQIGELAKRIEKLESIPIKPEEKPSEDEEIIDPDQPIEPDEPIEPEQPEIPDEPEIPEEPEVVYPEWVRPLGAHDCYNIGNIVNFNEKLYISKINNNVWSPIEYPQGWEIYVEPEIPEVEPEVPEVNPEEPVEPVEPEVPEEPYEPEIPEEENTEEENTEE